MQQMNEKNVVEREGNKFDWGILFMNQWSLLRFILKSNNRIN